MELTTEQALQQGITAHKEGKLQDAERLYRAILKSQPTHPDANHNLGVLAVSMNQADVALPFFKSAVESNPNVGQFWLSYIDALIKEQQFDNAKRALEQARQQGVDGDRLNPFDAQLSSKAKEPPTPVIKPPQELQDSLLGHYQHGRYGEAEKLAVEITQDFPEHEFAWKVLGAVLGATGRNSAALDAKQKVVALCPQDAKVHANLGNTLKELGRLDEAEASYETAIALNPGLAAVHLNFGLTLKLLGRLEEAEASYDKALALDPDYAEAHSNLGNALQELGRLVEAEASFNRAIALKPDFAEAYGGLGNTLQKQLRLDEAENSYNKAIAFKPGYAEAHSNLGVALQDLGRFEEAEDSFKKAIELKPELRNATAGLGNLLMLKGQHKEGLDLIRQSEGAVSLNRDHWIISS